MRQFRFSYDKAWMIRAVARYFVYREIISFFKRCYLFERERTSRGEGQREKQWTARREPDDNRQQCGTPSQDPGIMTWAEGRCLTAEPPRHPFSFSSYLRLQSFILFLLASFLNIMIKSLLLFSVYIYVFGKVIQSHKFKYCFYANNTNYCKLKLFLENILDSWFFLSGCLVDNWKECPKNSDY